jgi:hypothetical protein
MRLLEWLCRSWLLNAKKRVEYKIDTPINMEIVLLGGWYSGILHFGENSEYRVSGWSTFEGCFYALVNDVKNDRYTNLMDHSFTITFINKSHIKEVG